MEHQTMLHDGPCSPGLRFEFRATGLASGGALPRWIKRLVPQICI